jgi:hypothetical protein
LTSGFKSRKAVIIARRSPVSDPDDPWVYQQDFESTAHAHSGEHAMHVIYNKANEVSVNGSGETYTNAYSFFSAGGRYNFLNFDYLSFWVYNDGSPLRIKIRLEQDGDYSCYQQR